MGLPVGELRRDFAGIGHGPSSGVSGERRMGSDVYGCLWQLRGEEDGDPNVAARQRPVGDV